MSEPAKTPSGAKTIGAFTTLATLFLLWMQLEVMQRQTTIMEKQNAFTEKMGEEDLKIKRKDSEITQAAYESQRKKEEDDKRRMELQSVPRLEYIPDSFLKKPNKKGSEIRVLNPSTAKVFVNRIGLLVSNPTQRMEIAQKFPKDLTKPPCMTLEGDGDNVVLNCGRWIDENSFNFESAHPLEFAPSESKRISFEIRADINIEVIDCIPVFQHSGGWERMSPIEIDVTRFAPQLLPQPETQFQQVPKKNGKWQLLPTPLPNGR